ncbi:MAG: prephenate dehydratase [Candidatus Portiera sp.]|nr:prephenate dehydratase [Portiera sp.]
MATKSIKNLKDLRNEIDSIDDKLLELISQRASVAKQIGLAKEDSADKNKETVYLNPERQAYILNRVKKYAEKDSSIAAEQLCDIFTEIMSLCLNAEKLTDVVYLGPQGTYTQQATLKYFGRSAATKPVGSILEVFRNVESGISNYGVVPIENSSEGMVSNTMDVLATSNLKIVGEVKIPIHHCLLGHQWAKGLEDIKLIISHQQSFSQCHVWLAEHLPNIEFRMENSNAHAAQRALHTPNSAAIAGELNADLYGLNMIAKNIEDQPDNNTRFYIIGRQDTKPTGRDKTSLVLGAKNESGSLYRLLECFYKEQIDLNLLESHPTKMGDWQYNFFIDFYGHCQDTKVTKVIEQLKKQASFCKLLGSYPCYTHD